jgi:rhodanese-related sulfurtransferase
MKRYILVGILLLTMGAIIGCGGGGDNGAAPEEDYPPTTPGSYVDVTAPQAKKIMNDMVNLIIVDVSAEYNQGHIPGSLNYVLADGSLDLVAPILEKTKTYLVYARTDEESTAGAQKLIDLGLEKVYRLAGNFQAWVDAGYDVEVKEGQESDYHPVQ